MTKDELVGILRQQLQNCAGWGADGIQAARTDALNYYFQRPRGDEVPGRSTVVAGDVSASVEANLAQMVDAFSTDNIIEYDPLGPEDEDQAQLESDTVVHFVMKQQNGFIEMAAGIKNALLQRNGFTKCWVETFKQKRTRTFDDVEPEGLYALLASIGAKILSYAGKTLRALATREHVRFCCRSIAPGNMFHPLDWDQYDLQEIPFIAERHVDTRSELVRMGFPKATVAKLKPYGGANAGRADLNARDPAGGIQAPATPSADPSQDQIEWFECYALIDVDGDGVAERRRYAFVWNDSEVLEDVPAALVPYATGVVMLNPDRLVGISQYDKLRQTQDEHTGLKRALYDNVNSVTKSRLAYLDGKVNVDDVGDGRPNGAIRVKSNSGVEDVRTAVMPFVVPDNSANILANIEALKRERTELGGAALELASGQMQIGGDRMGSQGLDRAYSVMEQLAALMTKTIASTLIRNTFLLAHATLRENWNRPVKIKRNGKWQTAVPSKWEPRDRITVKIGMSPGERARKANALMQLLNAQIQLAQLGMDEVLVNVIGFYRNLTDWARVSDLQNPEQYLVDPQSDEAKKAFTAKAQKRAADDAARKSLMNRAIGTEETKVALDKYKHDSELQWKYWDGVQHSEIEEAKIVGHATTELLKDREVPDGQKGISAGAASKQAPARAA
ncbi:MAG TPA: hypothetical protein VFJ25_04575 [Casimicrobiaceae bacterium]|nr:hypothetical protein [Casimicrobiaceae bacterium]